MSVSKLEEIINYREISPALGTAGQPLRAQFQTIYEAGYQAVINLATPTSENSLPDEGAIVAGLGMEYVPIPVVWAAPRVEDFARFSAEMERLGGKKVFVHCALNYRVSAFVYLYRTLRMGELEETAREDMLSIWQPEGVWAEFIEQVKQCG